MVDVPNMAGLLTAKQQLPLAICADPMQDQYEVEARPFARGKFAAVRRCVHRESGREFAAKCMRKRRRAQDVRHEIVHELLILELSARHPNIVNLHEAYETHHEIILVLELVPGGELQRVLDEEERVSEVDATSIVRQVLAGVSFLHEHNIAHLDLKPQNVLLSGPLPDCNVKLCDFGISRLISKGVEVREIVGTPDYVAPEVLHYEPISLATDMWSAGIMTYVLLSGHSPFGGDTKQETFCNITRAKLEFPHDLFEGVSLHAHDFVRRLLKRDPRDRLTASECLFHPWLQSNSDGVQLTLVAPIEASTDEESSSEETTETFSSPRKQSNGVEVVVAQLEGLTVPKRIAFSEDIRDIDRVGMVY